MREYVEKAVDAFERARQFVSRDVWHLGRPGEKLPDGFIIKQVRVAILLFGNFIQDALLLRAAALSFATILFLVPFLIFMFAVIQTFNLGERVYEMWSDELEARLALVTAIVVGSPDANESAANQSEADSSSAEPPGNGATGEAVGITPVEDNSSDATATPRPPASDTTGAKAITKAEEREEASEKTHELLTALLQQFLPELPAESPEAVGLQNPVEMMVKYAEEAASPGTLGVMGIWFVLTTVFGLMRNVEDSFQRIWGLKETRSWFHMLSTYLLVALIIPFVAAGALGINAALGSERLSEQLGPFSFTLRVVQYTIIWLAFTIIYYFVPNTKVKLRYAFLSGVVAGTTWNLTAWAFWKFQFGLEKSTLLYSSLALVPVMLMWIYVSWIILLLGAELTFAYQNEKTFALERFADRANYAYREAVTLRTMVEVARRFDEGEDGLSSEQAAQAWNVPARLLNEILQNMEESDLVRACATDPVTYQPARSIDKIKVGDVLRALREAGKDPSLLRDDETFRPLLDRLTGNNEFLDTSFRDLLEQMRSGDVDLVKEISTNPAPSPEIQPQTSASSQN